MSASGDRVRGDDARGLTSDELAREILDDLAGWESAELAESTARQPEAKPEYRSGSGLPVKRVYTPADLPESWDEIGLPGRFPFTRGPYPTMYRGRVWTMRQI